MLKNLSNQFLKEEDGAGLLEYLVLAALAAIIAVFLFPSLRNYITDWFGTLTGNISDEVDPDENGTDWDEMGPDND